MSLCQAKAYPTPQPRQAAYSVVRIYTPALVGPCNCNTSCQLQVAFICHCVDVLCQRFTKVFLVHFQITVTETERISMKMELIYVEQQLVFLNLLRHRKKEVVGGDDLYNSDREGGAGKAVLPSQPITVLVVCIAVTQLHFWGLERQATTQVGRRSINWPGMVSSLVQSAAFTMVSESSCL